MYLFPAFNNYQFMMNLVSLGMPLYSLTPDNFKAFSGHCTILFIVKPLVHREITSE